jgi:hypothetical protein
MAKGAFVTVARAPDLAAAQVVRGVLEAEGIDCFLPDETLAGQMWHMSRAIGGVRIDVHAEDEETARTILAAASQPAEPTAEELADDVSPGDRLANRARKAAVIGFMLWPFVHPYALSLSVRALRDPTLTPAGRPRARLAAVVSAASVGVFFTLLYAFLRLLRGP